MGQLIISTNLSLDGVVQDPDGLEGSGPGGWFGRSGRPDLDAWAEHALQEALGATALLLGRRSDQWFAQRWPARTGAFADRLNGMPRYVVSATRQQAEWNDATILRGDPVARVAALKRELTGEILVYAGGRLGRTLLEHDLVDELRLVVFPVVVGDGQRLFGPTGGPKPLRLLQHRTIGAGLAFLRYQVLTG